ncbi:hypothetical protein C1631_001875 [Chryseobacterium phosphatilyticum]|uniref:Uncharacterized protein n=1 Tax=Chryseobacterium phosphatilyticum TaxID=475075 RepID=A0A316XF83_9FLAO|nr:hypothetical protein [Chryseobacterium phosphatilyticum]PWN71396.1 hypothetical protein C1631_001875 [Chryseobacterium phosphatilyticum]
MKNTYPFLLLSTALLALFSCKDPGRKKTNFPNELKNTRWIVDSGGLVSPEGEKTYYMSKRIDTAIILNFHAIDFLDGEKFKSYDAWECGNDCFTEVHGRYYFTEVHQVKMEVDSIRKWGTCDTPTQIFKPAKDMTFDIMKEKGQLKFIRK